MMPYSNSYCEAFLEWFRVSTGLSIELPRCFVQTLLRPAILTADCKVHSHIPFDLDAWVWEHWFMAWYGSGPVGSTWHCTIPHKLRWTIAGDMRIVPRSTRVDGHLAVRLDPHRDLLLLCLHLASDWFQWGVRHTRASSPWAPENEWRKGALKHREHNTCARTAESRAASANDVHKITEYVLWICGCDDVDNDDDAGVDADVMMMMIIMMWMKMMWLLMCMCMWWWWWWWWCGR